MIKVKKILSNLLYMLRFSWKVAKDRYFYACIKIVINTIQPFVFLLIPKYIIDELTNGARWEKVIEYILILLSVKLVFTVVGQLLSYGDYLSKQINWVKNRIINDTQLMNMDYDKFEDNSTRDFVEAVQYVTKPYLFVDDFVVPFFTSLFQLAGYTYIIATLHPLIIVFIIVIIFLSSKISDKNEKIKYDYQHVLASHRRKFTYLFKTMLNFDFAKEIRIGGADAWIFERYQYETEEYLKSYTKNQRSYFKTSVLSAVVSFFQTIVLYGYCAYKAISKLITVGDFSLYLGSITNFTSSFTGFVGKIVEIKYLSQNIENYQKYLELSTPSAMKKGNVKIPVTGKYEIEFRDVWFQYPNTENYVLKNINIKIPYGQKLAIVGFNGAGKTTFIKLLCRLYEPTKGAIYLNGVDIGTINVDQYREFLSVIFQDFVLFKFPVADNIILSNTFDRALLDEVISKSGLEDKVKGLKRGVDTQIGKEFDPEGIEFSGGEGQKLAAARAYYKNAPIVILDEPTASLDAVAESEMYEKFKDIIGTKTSLYISHRMAAVKFCDIVAVFCDGRIEEYGTHDELISNGGIYADMFEKQSMYYREEAEQ